MKLKPLGVQLYTVREAAEKDFAKTLERIAAMGYKTVQPSGFWNVRPKVLRQIVEDLGMKINSAHSPEAGRYTMGEAMDLADNLGIKTLCVGYGPDAFQNMDKIKETADTTNCIIEIARKNGFTIFQHNHFWEFERLPDGRLKYQVYAEMCPELLFEIDAFWSTNLFQENEVEMMKLFADRTMLLHFKDGKPRENPANNNPFERCELCPLGKGRINIPAVLDAATDRVEEVLVELDTCNIEIFEALQQSYDYMTGNKLAAGRI